MHIFKSLFFLIEKFGYLFVPLILNFSDEKNQLLVFYFHGLYKTKKEKELNHVDPQNNITVSEFTCFIDYFLKHKYHFIKPGDLLTGMPVNGPCVMITFDDGYFNNVLAVDVLKKYGIPASFFISTSNVLENKSFWWDIIYKYRKKQGAHLKKIRTEQAFLKSYKSKFIEDYVEMNFGKNCHQPWSDIDRPMSVEELKGFSKIPLVSIGNHTHNHSILTNNNSQEIKEELEFCNKKLFEITGTTPDIIAFPNGNFNEKILEIVQSAGFRFAFTIENKVNHLPLSNNRFTCLSRFMALPLPMYKYAGLNRLGYSFDSLNENIKRGVRGIYR